MTRIFKNRTSLAILFFAATAPSLFAVPRLRLSNTVVGPVTVAPGANPAVQELEAYSVADRDTPAETENLRLAFTSTAPWVAARAGALRACARRQGQCVPVQLTFSTASLTAGAYSASILVTDPTAIDAPQNIVVSLQVGSTLPDRVNLYATPNGGSDEFAFNTNSNVESNVSPANSWLTVSQLSAGTFNFVRPFKIAARQQPSGGQPLAEGTYNGTVQIRNSALVADNKTVNVAFQVTSQPIARAGSAALRVRIAQNTPKQLHRVRINNRGLGRLAVGAATASVTGGGSWLTAAKLDGFDIIDVNLDPANVNPGVYRGNVAVAHNGVNSPLNIPVELEVVAQAAPAIRFQGILDNAVFEENDVIAAGGIVAAFGEQFTYQEAAVATSLPLPTELGGVRVFVNDRPAPAYYSSYGQVNFQVPYDVAPGQGTVRIDRGSTRGNAVSVTFAAAVPKILRIQLRAAGIAMPESRVFFGIAVNPDGTLSLPRELGIPNSRPSRPGEVITIYGLGFGQTSPPVVAGQAAPSTQLARVNSSNGQVWFGALSLNSGVPSDAQYIGLTPGLVGLYQINVAVPENSPKGDVPIRVQLDTVASEYALIAVE